VLQLVPARVALNFEHSTVDWLQTRNRSPSIPQGDLGPVGPWRLNSVTAGTWPCGMTISLSIWSNRSYSLLQCSLERR